MYQHLPDDDKQDIGKITKALRIGFAVYSFTAYEQFVGRRLQHGETVDVFLAELRRLAVPFGGLSDKMLACAFVAGLPDTVKQLLRAGSRMEGAGDRPTLLPVQPAESSGPRLSTSSEGSRWFIWWAWTRCWTRQC